MIQYEREKKKKLAEELKALERLQAELFREATGDTNDDAYQAALAVVMKNTGLSQAGAVRWAVMEMARQINPISGKPVQK